MGDGRGVSDGGVSVKPPPFYLDVRRNLEISAHFSVVTTVAFRTALPRFLLAAVFRRVRSLDLQVYSRTRVRASSKWILWE